VTVSLEAAVVIALPVLLVQLYAFIAPALAAEVRAVVRRLMFAAPVLLAAGLAFGYFIVLPTTLRFLLNFNSGQFTELVQASQYYRFAATLLLALALLFQIPLAIVILVRAGLVTPAALRRRRRYALAVCVAIAAVLPGEVITMALETVPLYLLFELGVAAAALAERGAARRAARAQG
jgi:sec-independent protein translocase protein TatC